MSGNLLDIRNLTVSIMDSSKENAKINETTSHVSPQIAGKKNIIKDFSLSIGHGEVHALMGPNGSGKSTLTNAIMGHPAYKIESGSIWFKGNEITELPTHERARLGLFVSFQYPSAIPGVTLTNFLRTAVNSIRPSLSVRDFRLEYKASMEKLKISPQFTSRYINDGFSGGEKKRIEILQLAMLKPSLAILDEIDSGLDVDALHLVAEGINTFTPKEASLLLITHYQRLLNYIKPQFVHVFANGKIIESGDFSLAEKIEVQGYDWILPSKKNRAK